MRAIIAENWKAALLLMKRADIRYDLKSQQERTALHYLCSKPLEFNSSNAEIVKEVLFFLIYSLFRLFFN